MLLFDRLLPLLYCFCHGLGMFLPDKNISPCFGLSCKNGGSVDSEACRCLCPSNYGGALCDKEIKPSSWPGGSYSLLSTVFGCPESDNHGWKTGYLNLTVSSETNTRQWFPERFRLMGPYHLHTIQLNFCTQLQDMYEVETSGLWPPGNYCVVKAEDKFCPQDFSESSLPLKDYSVWQDNMGGFLPDFNISDVGITLMLCCRNDGEIGTATDLPPTFPFYLLKPYHTETCQDITDMVLREETFSFVKTTNRTWLENYSSFTVEESDLYFDLTFCYYEAYERRECMYIDDSGASYRGRVNVTNDGRQCQRWDNNTHPISQRNYEGDFDDNYCRQTWFTLSKPYCVIDENLYLCDIPVCDSSNDFPNVIKRKVYRSAPVRSDTAVKYIADGITGKPPFAVGRPYIEPWVQVDLQEDYEIHSVLVYKAYNWSPYNNRRLVTYVSRHQWDFLTFGAYTCDGPYNPARTRKFRFQCRRPLIGSFVTIQNFVRYDPNFNDDFYRYFALSEIVIRGKSTVCGKSLGVKSGSVQDFQIVSSTDMTGYYGYYARLNRETGWCADSDDHRPFLQVDLLTPMVVEGIIIQGWMDGRTARIPNNFTLEYGNREGNLTSYLNSVGEIKVFRIDQSFAPSALQKFWLPKQFLTRIVRIYLHQPNSPVCVKFDIIGCPRKVEFDLKCQSSSSVIGLQVLHGHSFYQILFNKSFINPDSTLESCRDGYFSNPMLYASYRFDEPNGDCKYLLGNRYSRHNQHWWVTGLGRSIQYGQRMCVKDITDAGPCGGHVKTRGEITSPGYPFYYGENINCTWVVVLPEGSYVSLDMIDVNLEKKEESLDSSAYFDCEDKLSIYDRHRHGDHLVTMVTGYPFDTLEGPRYISSSNELEINLVSCHRVMESDARGFKLAVDTADCSGCGQGEFSCSRQAVCTDQCGYISSTNFPNYYSVSSSCQWRIQGQMGQYVTVTFEMIDVIAEEDCEGDFVILFDLDLSQERSVIGKFCKFKRPIGEIESSWNMMDVEFYSDFQTTGRGFLLKYTLMTIQLTSVSSNASDECNDTWYEYEHRCYSFNTNNDGLSWIDAEAKCNQDSGHLVSISNADEMLFLHSTIVNNNLFTEQETYIGLQKIGNDEFTWTDGKPLTHTEWYGGGATPRQPDGLDKEACTMMKISGIRSTANWHDVACAFDKVYQYICEIERITSVTPHERRMVPGYLVSVKTGYYFSCISGETISRLYLCDGSPDCTDGSDEHNCTVGGCAQGMFSCNDGGCVNIAFYCDHKPHCPDGSDEDNCVHHDCTAEQWRCSSGQCVANQQRCDLIVNCIDGTDEKNCERCQESFFQCYDGRCLPPARVCDGFVDCGGQYREDEGPQCTTNSQPSCSTWYALGARQNGSYTINMDGDTDSHTVECIFNTSEDVITTIIHHTMEDTTVTGNVPFDQLLHYTIPKDVIAYVMSTASACRQHVHFDCLQSFDIYKKFSKWYDVTGKERSFSSEPGSNCSCILQDACNGNNSECACDKTREELFMVDDSLWLTDSGYLNEVKSLPITRLWIDDQLRLGRLRHRIGPLICEEPVQKTTMSVLCKNGVVVDISNKCILDYDIYHHYTGCRDLTHIQDCETFTCPIDHIKCPSSYCIPLRLVCDGHPDCADGMDEMECANMTCPERFHCHGNSVCIAWNQVCDGIHHCPEGEDEYFCNTSCPGACECNGSSVTCSSLYIDDVKRLPTHTRILDLRESVNETITNHTFHHMEDLAILDLSFLGVHGLEKYCFSGLENLLYLDLSMNFLKEIPKGLFSTMRNLKTLILTGNKISHIYPGSFIGLQMLPSLDISNMNLKYLSGDVFQGLSNLLSLNLSGNSVSAVDDGCFRGAYKLQSLDLRDNSITSFTGDIFSGLNKLTHLYNDKYVFCCFKPSTVSQDSCLPKADEFSSCSDLMRNETLRISMWVLGFLALVGNIIVILSRCIYDRQSLRRSNDFFVANLALSDFFMGTYMIIIASADAYYRGVYSWNDEIWRSSWVCQMAGFLATLSGETSVMFLCMITLERVLVIKFPFKDFILIQKSSRYVCFFVWCIGILFAGIPLLPLSYFSGSFYSRSGVCLALPLTRNRPPGWEYSTVIFVFWNFICFVVIAFGQAVIYHTVKASQKMRKGKTSNDMVIARKLSFIVLTDFVCWFPVCVMGLMALQGHIIGSEVYAWVAVFVLPINSALNPIIYTLSSVDTMRQRRMKRSQTFSSAQRSTVQTKTTVSHLLKKEFMCLTQPPNSVCLTSYLPTVTSAKDILTIVYKLSSSLEGLHAVSVVSGDVETDSIYVVFDNGRISRVVASCLPMATNAEEEFSKDILDFGHVVSKMLRAYTVTKTQRLKN